MKPYYEQDGLLLYEGDVLATLAEMEPESVDCVVTSPPYWSLRKYSGDGAVWGGDPSHAHEFAAVAKNGAISEGYGGTGRWQHAGHSRDETPDDWTRVTRTTGMCECGAWYGQYGLEPSPEMYVEHTLTILRALRRVLKPTGTVWWNIGDGYAAGNRGEYLKPRVVSPSTAATHNYADLPLAPHRLPQAGLKPKDMIAMPWRVGLAAQADGWWLRSDIIWAKPNPMPESVTDRPTKSHEYVLLLAKSERYYFDADSIRRPLAAATLHDLATRANPGDHNGATKEIGKSAGLGAGPRVKGDKQRGHSRRHDGFNDRWGHMTKAEQQSTGANERTVWTIPTQPSPLPHFAAFPEALAERCIKAGCPPDGVVLDPFAGTGTTLKVARANRRNGIGIEISAEYCALAAQRLRVGIAGVMRVMAGQAELL